MNNLTPAMRQYMEIKNKNPDCLVLFRMGDFYETFYDDAKLAAKVLNITLTARGKGEKKSPLAGIPYHALNTYLTKLIKNNIKVAIVEQTEDPKKAKGLVKRDLIRIITPGTIVEEDFLQGNENNYLLAVSSGTSKEPFGLAYVDISTGEFKVSQVDNEEKLRNEIAKLNPSEIIVSSEEKLKFNHYTTKRPVHTFFIGNAKELLEDHFKAPINSFGIESKQKVVEAAGALINYLKETQKTSLSYINKISYYELSNFMTIDASTQKNLELVKNIMDNSKKGTLYEVMDKTVTSAGAREFKRWLLRPLIKVDDIRKRQESVEILKDDALLRAEIRDVLKQLYDIERLISKVSFGSANPKDMISLKLSLSKLPELLFLLKDKTGLLGELSVMPDVNDIVKLLEHSLTDEPPITIREGGIIKTNFNDKLDELHNIKKDGRKFISQIENREIKNTNIKSLKVKFNRVFGYFIEVTKKNVHLVPENYIRKQTQANCERYITQELKEIEEKILGAQEKINEMEYELFNEIVSKVNLKTKKIQEIASKLAKIDVLSSLSELADKNSYCKPQIDNGYDFDIKESRHPVIESFEDNFISNDCTFSTKQKMMIITGPNMAGKSTYMRQIALIALMAQIGSFVPAAYAKIGVVDRIFSRVGAYDDLAHGQSTFMVEMTETANILNNASDKSLIILDEIGRGTSTFDGVAIAWSVAEHIHENIKAKTMFATHYHVLNTLEKAYSDIKNYNIAVLEEKNKIVFLRKIVSGATDKSYGIHVAALAGVPNIVVQRAKKLQAKLEQQDKMDKNINGKRKIENQGLKDWIA